MSKRVQAEVPMRRRIYVDRSLQGHFSFALVLFEAVLILAACGYLYHALADLLDERLYSIHAVGAGELYSRMAGAVLGVLAACVGANALLVIGVQRAWRKRVANILALLTERLDRLHELRLDDAHAAYSDTGPHRLLEVFDAWKSQECERLRRVAAVLACPAPNLAEGGERSASELAAALDRVGNHLRRG